MTIFKKKVHDNNKRWAKICLLSAICCLVVSMLRSCWEHDLYHGVGFFISNITTATSPVAVLPRYPIAPNDPAVNLLHVLVTAECLRSDGNIDRPVCSLDSWLHLTTRVLCHIGDLLPGPRPLKDACSSVAAI